MQVTFKHYRIRSEDECSKRTKGKPHRLEHYWQGRKKFTPASRGGLTVCMVYNPDTGILVRGVSTCSMSDIFCYRTGREIAYARAMKNYWERVEKKAIEVTNK